MHVSSTSHKVALCLLLSFVVLTVPTAAELVIRGGTIHPVSAGVPFVGDIVVSEGLIIQSGRNELPVSPEAEVIDATGLHVYPGMFDALSTLGLVEVNAVSATDDRSEMGAYNPHLRAATAIHPASKVIPVTRANGVTHTVVAPSGDRDGVIGGQAALINLNGWTIEEMAIDPSVAMAVRWPAIVTRSFDFSTFEIRETPFAEAEEKAEEAQQELRQWIEAARHYSQAAAAASSRLERNLELEALSAVLDGQQPILVTANTKRDIESAVEMAEDEGLTIIIAGGRDAWKVKTLLAEKGIPVILGRTQSLPQEDDDPYYRAFTNAAELVEAGVEIAFASAAGGSRGPGGPHSARTLPYEAAMAVAYGLDGEAALRAVTLAPAKIFGVDDQLGSIDAGKIANLIVTDGNPLEITTQVRHLIIAGLEISLDNHHQRLYERYRSRPPAALGSAAATP